MKTNKKGLIVKINNIEYIIYYSTRRGLINEISLNKVLEENFADKCKEKNSFMSFIRPLEKINCQIIHTGKSDNLFKRKLLKFRTNIINTFRGKT